MNQIIDHIAVIGGGAWGTALAQTSRRAGRRVTLWAREPEVARAINATHENPDFLPGVSLDPGLHATADLAEALRGAEAVLVVCPAQALRPVLTTARPLWPGRAPMVICAKGVEQGSGARMSEVATAVLPEAPLAVLSGPTFAREVAEGRPTAVTLACADGALAEALVLALGTRTFRPYASTDVVGAEIGGAVKNVLAIACGVVEGLGLGDNARAALLTRGLAEITRLGRALGARSETLSGLSGLGDLILTATSMQSRNFSLGFALGQGRTLDQVLGERRSVAEGVHTASAVVALAARWAIEMPICAAIHGVLSGDHDVTSAIESLLSRPLRVEGGSESQIHPTPKTATP
ncbi:glycerol-3-phosphate acyltransferase [Rhodospirillum rubrum]|uniref:NAD(P)H-dependent glycerol-3-phosphate dehydrogenase n=1 Tax=Rhodospirillum rubrum TaxID=1085 RepID=UPI001906FD1E|nr:NAD(P)H-dependent glycerol-3-phosphate dehydrogenase [Rhodospirillum rubrum]MBK1664221.1 glycerol-3-phosphate acyltransferase [Rhodospirillum rubrum]MBK1676447.1 glycerol-3-phosphate acyltransferase [Rhodospirillum rubrum]